jgi:hypothetical protein
LSRTALEIAKQHQALRDAASRRSSNRVETPVPNSRADVVAWGRQTPLSHAQRQNRHHRRSSPKQQAGHDVEPNGVSRNDASKEVTTPAGVAVARPIAGPGFHPETVQQGCCSTMVPNRESDGQRRRRHFARTNLVRAFARSDVPPLRPFATVCRHHHCSRFNRGDVHAAAPHNPPSWLRLAVAVPTYWRRAGPMSTPAAAFSAATPGHLRHQ